MPSPEAVPNAMPGPLAERIRSYLADLRASTARLAEAFLPLAPLEAETKADLLSLVLEAERQILVGSPGSGKTALLRAAAFELAGRHGRPGARLPLYLDLAKARPGEGVEEMAVRQLESAGLAGQDIRSLAPLTLLLDNLDRATDVYLLEGLELLVRAGGQAGPRVIIACRQADWSNYRVWLEGISVARIAALEPERVAEAIGRALPSDAASLAQAWLERDRALAEAVRRPRTLQAMLDSLRADPPAEWRRGRVMRVLLEAHLVGIPASARSGYRSALRDVALGGLGRGPLLEVDTVAMGLGVTRDDMIRTGAVEAHGPALAFVEPMLATQLVATALKDRSPQQPARLAGRLEGIDLAARVEILAQIAESSHPPERFLAGLMQEAEGPELVARCLAAMAAAAPEGPRGPLALVDGLAGQLADAGLLYRLGEALRRQGLSEAAELAGRLALGRTPAQDARDSTESGSISTRLTPSGPSATGPELDRSRPSEALGTSAKPDMPQNSPHFDRPDVDAPPPIEAWLQHFARARNRGLALRGAEDLRGATDALEEAQEALDRVEGDLVFERGMVLAASGDHEDALAAFDHALSREPERARYLYHHGRTLIALDRAAEAIEELQRAREASPGQAEIEASLADAYRARGWIEEALSAFEAASRLAPQVAGYAQSEGELQAELGDLEGAAASMQRAAAGRPSEAAWHDALGQVLAELGRWPAAIRAFRRAHILVPGEMSYLRHLGRAHLAAGDAGAAVDALEKACTLAPEAPGPVADLGLALAQAGDLEAATSTLQMAVAMDDAWPADHLKLAQLLRAGNELDGSLAHARRAVDLAPASAAAQGELGRVHDARGEYREALSAYVSAAERAPQQAAPREAVADAYAELGDADSAAQAIEMATWLDPQRPSALDRLARLQEDSGSMAEALESMRQVLAMAPEVLEYLRRAGRLCQKLGLDAEAVEHFERAAAQAPGDAALQHELGMALCKTGQAERAMGFLRRAARLAPETPDYLADLVEVARNLGRLNEARSAADAALAMAPERADLFAIKAEVERAAGDLDAARAAYRRALTLAPQTAAYSAGLAELYESSEPETARRLLEQAAEIAPDAELSRRLAELEGGRGAWERAADEYARAMNLRPEDPVLRAAHCAALLEAGRLPEAIERLEAARRELGEEAVILVQLGQAYEATGRDADALAAFAAAGEGPAMSPGTCLRWSRLAQRVGDIDAAILAARRAAAARPEWPDAYATLSDAYAAGGLSDAALTAMRSAAGLAPDRPEFRQAQARLARELGRHDEAITALEEAIAANPGEGSLHYELGRAFEAQGWLLEARESFARAVEVAPQVARYLRALALHRAKDDLEEAVRLLRRALASAPEEADNAYQLGRLLARQGSDADARAAFQKAIGLAPKEPDYHRALGLCLARMGDAGALERLRQAVDLAPGDADSHAALGECFLAQGRRRAALASYTHAAGLAPQRVDLQLMQGALLLACHEAGAAREILEAAIQLDPERAETHLALALAYEQLGEAALAREARAAAETLAVEDPTGRLDLGRIRLALGERGAALEALESAVALRPDDTRALRWLAEARRMPEGLAEPEDEAALEGLASSESARLERPVDGVATPAAMENPSLSPSESTLLPESPAAPADLPDASSLAAARRATAAGWSIPLAAPELVPPLSLDSLHYAALEAALEFEMEAEDAHPAIEAGLALARLRGRSGDVAGALAAAERTADRDGAPLALLTLGWARLLAGDPALALEALGMADALGEDGPELHLLVGQAQAGRGDHALAVAAFERAAERAPDAATPRHRLAESEAARGNDAAALAAFQAAYALDEGPTLAAEIGRQARQAGAAETVLPFLQASAERWPKSGPVLAALGLAQREAGELPAAVEALDRALALEPERADWHAELGAALREAGEFEQARERYQRAAELEPGLHEHRLGEIELGLALGELDAAEAALNALDAEAARLPVASLLAARLRLERNDPPGAMAILERAAEIAPEDAELQYWLGRVAREIGQPDRAQRHLEAAARIDKGFVEALLALGGAYRDAGAVFDAIQAYEQAVSCDPDSLTARLSLAEVCIEADLADRAVLQYEKAADLAPDDPRPLCALGRARLATERPDLAVEAYALAIARAPGDAEIYLEAGLAHKALRDYERALGLFRQALGISPRHKLAYAQLAATSALQFVDRAPVARGGSDEVGS